ncbi:hypothetical protein [Trichocoleus sp. FACHB-591]|nr:hypothetical protein [Trichocoleus sp. FACHB-591]
MVILAKQGNATNAFSPEPMRFLMFVWALARLIAVVTTSNIAENG